MTNTTIDATITEQTVVGSSQSQKSLIDTLKSEVSKKIDTMINTKKNDLDNISKVNLDSIGNADYVINNLTAMNNAKLPTQKQIEILRSLGYKIVLKPCNGISIDCKALLRLVHLSICHLVCFMT